MAQRLKRNFPKKAGGRNGEDRIMEAYRLALGREPRSSELAAAVGFLRRQAQQIGPAAPEAEDEALVDFCHAMLNSNEFLYVD